MSYSYILYLLFSIKFTDLDHIHLSTSINFCLANVIFILQNALNIFKQRKSNLYSILYTQKLLLSFILDAKQIYLDQCKLVCLFSFTLQNKTTKGDFSIQKSGEPEFILDFRLSTQKQKMRFSKMYFKLCSSKFWTNFCYQAKTVCPNLSF